MFFYKPLSSALGIHSLIRGAKDSCWTAAGFRSATLSLRDTEAIALQRNPFQNPMGGRSKDNILRTYVQIARHLHTGNFLLQTSQHKIHQKM